MKILKRLVYMLLMIPICTIVFVIESPLLPLIILAIWVITGNISLRMKVTKGCRSFYVYTITQIVYYSGELWLGYVLIVLVQNLYLKQSLTNLHIAGETIMVLANA